MAKALNAFQKKFYADEQEQQSNEFRSLADLFLAGRLTQNKFSEAMNDSLRQYYIRLALVAKGGRVLTLRDRTDVGKFLRLQESFVAGFSSDLRDFRDTASKEIKSIEQALSRAGSYANGWGVFTRFSIPAALADVLPALPGLDCLGGFLCGCWLEWSSFDTIIEVYWHTNPFKTHCALCASYDIEWSPYTIELDELDPDLVEEDREFLLD